MTDLKDKVEADLNKAAENFKSNVKEIATDVKSSPKWYLWAFGGLAAALVAFAVISQLV